MITIAQQPIDRKAQSVDGMATQLSSARQGKMYGANYKEVSDELKREALTANIGQQLEILQSVYERGKVNLDDVEEVRAAAFAFMSACKDAAVFPTMLAFSAALGISRQRLYAYINTHNNASTEFLDVLRSSWASILAEQSLKRQTDNATAIFLLKNSGQQLTDRHEMEIDTKPKEPLEYQMTAEEIMKYYSELPAD